MMAGTGPRTTVSDLKSNMLTTTPPHAHTQCKMAKLNHDLCLDWKTNGKASQNATTLRKFGLLCARLRNYY